MAARSGSSGARHALAVAGYLIKSALTWGGSVRVATDGPAPQMLARYGASARSARARRTYDRIMTDSP